MPDGPVEPRDTYTLLRRVMDIVGNSRTLPLSSSVKLDNRDEVLELLEEAMGRLPEELKAARWMVKERQEYLDKTQGEADEILEAARIRAERMVQRTELVREARHVARRLVDDARDEARRVRHEAEDYCDQKLAAFELVLERTLKTVEAGREKLAATPPPAMAGPNGFVPGGDGATEPRPGGDRFFDQDRS